MGIKGEKKFKEALKSILSYKPNKEDISTKDLKHPTKKEKEKRYKLIF